jgi:maleate cis-trans isomerase
MPEKQTEFLVGVVNPTNRPEPKEVGLDEKLPENIRFVTRTLNFTRGTEEEFAASMPAYESKVGELAAIKADLIRPSGAPPFMLLGFAGERRIIRGWENKYGIPMFTSGQNHVRALRTLGVRRFVGASYFPEKMNALFARYFSEAGFEVLAMDGIPVAFADVPSLPAPRVSEHITGLLEKHRGAEAIYLLGSAWRVLEIIDPLERVSGLPVVHPGPARNWETLLRLGFRQGIQGYGRLLAEMPEPVPLV